jgi:hypothetical protein
MEKKWDTVIPADLKLVTKESKIPHVFTVQACDFVATQRKNAACPHADTHENHKCSTAGLIPNFTKIGKNECG